MSPSPTGSSSRGTTLGRSSRLGLDREVRPNRGELSWSWKKPGCQTSPSSLSIMGECRCCQRPLPHQVARRRHQEDSAVEEWDAGRLLGMLGLVGAVLQRICDSKMLCSSQSPLNLHGLCPTMKRVFNCCAPQVSPSSGALPPPLRPVSTFSLLPNCLCLDVQASLVGVRFTRGVEHLPHAFLLGVEWRVSGSLCLRAAVLWEPPPFV